jgi:hypothetical protein
MKKLLFIIFFGACYFLANAQTISNNATVTNRITAKELRVEHTAMGGWNFAAHIKVNNILTRALTIENSATNEDVFVVYGNGVLSAKKIFTEKIEVTLDALNNYWYDHVFYPDYIIVLEKRISEIENKKGEE